MLVPVHTFAPHSFPEHFEAVALKQDGEWWEVAA
jgi:ribonuclease J